MGASPPGPGGPQDHYFATSPDAPERPRSVELVLPDGLLLPLTTDAGVFSADRVDPGTRVLLAEGPALSSSGDFLDLGCGYGPIACTLARRAPAATVWAIDVNERARALCRRNADALGVGDRVHVVDPEAVPEDVRFDELWSNPPIRVGKVALHGLLTTWLPRLTPQGRAVLVVQKNLGADSLARWLTDHGWPTTRLTSRQGYRLLEVRSGRAEMAQDEVGDQP